MDFGSAHPRYRRAVLRPDGTAAIEDAASGVAEFPRIDPRRTGRRHRFVFALAGNEDGDGWPLRRAARIDPERGETDGWAYPPHQVPEEHVFVPRGETEGDGWLIGPFLDTRRGTAGLNVFEASRVSDGPLWRGVLPYPVPLGLHGIFTPA